MHCVIQSVTGLFLIIYLFGCAPKTSVTHSSCTAGKQVFSHTGNEQFFNLPENCSNFPQIFVKLWGAGGGGPPNASYPGYPGGNGAFAFGSISISPNSPLTVITGRGGLSGVVLSNGLADILLSGGYGGGGNALAAWSAGAGYGAGSGGGRSAIQEAGVDLITAAGGGGGTTSNVTNRSGGAGGDSISGGIPGRGYGFTDLCPGQGGAPLAGGNGGRGISNLPGYPGTQYQGGNGGGGGGGTFSSDPCGGGGGSSYIGEWRLEGMWREMILIQET